MIITHPHPGQIWARKRQPDRRYKIVRVCGMTYSFQAFESPPPTYYRPLGEFGLLLPDKVVWLCKNGYAGQDFGELVFGVNIANSEDKICCPVRSWQAILIWEEALQ